MEIVSAQFVKGVVGTDPLAEDPRLQVAFIGRSNVGKSSVINSLTGRKGLAKSSATPGKTLQINYFLINKELFFVDLPGYGYARAGGARREKIRKMILWYLFASHTPRAMAVLVVDAQVGLTDFDRELLQALHDAGRETIIVANKVDKLNQSERVHRLRELVAEAGAVPVVPYSAKTGLGREEVWRVISE